MIRETKVIPLVCSRPDVITTRLHILQQVTLIGALGLRMAKVKEGSGVVCTQVQQLKVRYLQYGIR